MVFQQSFIVNTPGRGMIDVTSQVADLVSKAEVTVGICHVFLHHTSASLLISENDDITVQQDLEAFMGRLIPDGDCLFSHTAEGPDDMPSHVRSILTQSSVSVPVTQHQLALGTWQGIFLWEHRLRPYQRKVTVTIY